MLFRKYVLASERPMHEIAEEIKQKVGTCTEWARTSSPVYVEISATSFEKIKEVYRVERLYPVKVAKKTKKIKPQIKRR